MFWIEEHHPNYISEQEAKHYFKQMFDELGLAEDDYLRENGYTDFDHWFDSLEDEDIVQIIYDYRIEKRKNKFR